MLHFGWPHLSSLATAPNLAAMTLLAVALWRAVAGPAPAQPVRKRVFVPLTVVAAVGWLATPTAVLMAHPWVHVAAFGYIAIVIAWGWTLRAGQAGEDGRGGGDQNVGPEPPEDPGGGGIDWDLFESDFWNHVGRDRDRPLTPA